MTSPPTVPPPAPPPRRVRGRLPRWARVALVLVLVGLVALLAVVVLLAWGLSGGWDGLRGTASADDRSVVHDRAGAAGELTDLSRSVVAALDAGEPVARIRHDRCEQGQNNWKRHDGYTLRCELTESVVLRPAPADVTADVTAEGARLDAALVADGWQPEGGQDEMTLPADPDHSFLEQTRAHRYLRDSGRHQVDVGVTTRAGSPVPGDVPYDPATRVEGDLTAYRAAVAAPGAKVVARTTVRYFEDR